MLRKGLPAQSLIRRLVQLSVIAFLFVLPAANLHGGYLQTLKAKDIEPGDRWKSIYAGNPYVIAYYKLARDWPEADVLAHKAVGGTWAAELYGVSMADPLALSDVTAASGRLDWSILWLAAIPVALTLLLGRVFCGWICPAYLLFEVGGWLRSMLEKIGLRFFDIRPPKWVKYGVLVVGLVGCAATGLTIFSWIYPPALATLAVNEQVMYGILSAAIPLLLLIVLVELLFGKRLWCACLCPGGALYSLLGTRRVLRISRTADGCTWCTDCNDVCPYALDPMRTPPGNECDNCGKCVKVCEDGTLLYTFASPLKKTERTYRGAGK